tara:strand:+ start:476 stop:745 length:270 start_codon:yes stop_codon:yes gene_type:complete
MPITHNLVAKTGTYTNKNGEQKTRWVRCGVAMTTKTGKQSFLIEQLPVNFDGWINLADLDEKQKGGGGANAGTSHANAGFDDMESDVPF